LDPKTTHGQCHKLYNANNPLFLFLHSIKVFFVKVDGGHSSRFVFKPHFLIAFSIASKSIEKSSGSFSKHILRASSKLLPANIAIEQTEQDFGLDILIIFSIS